VDLNVARTIVARIEEHMRSSGAQMAVAQLRVLGGAMARVPADATAFAHRASRIMVNLAALYDPSQDASVHESWVDAFARQLRQSDAGAYVNFIGDEGPARIRAAYPGRTWDRLVEVKRRYDPTNFFRLNQNIPPNGA
jgi:FAD/FMN-containing dehydrogenase